MSRAPLSLLRASLLVAEKDLRIELRTKELLSAAGLFSALIVFIASLAFYLDPAEARRIAPGVVYVAAAFSGVLAFGRAFARERELGAMRGLRLTPIPRAAIYLGKFVATFVLLAAINLGALLLVALFFHLELDQALAHVAAFLLLTTAGFTAAGCLFGALTVVTRARDLMLSVVLFPLLTPAILIGVVGSREALDGAPSDELGVWYLLLSAFFALALGGGLTLFELLIED